MATTLLEVKRAVIELMADTETLNSNPLTAGQLSARLLLDGVRAALVAICQKAPRHAVATVGGGVSEFTLPEDLYEVVGVQDMTTGLFLDRLSFVANVMSADGVTWTDFPAGSITFSSVLGESGARLFYDAIYPAPVYTEEYQPDEFDIEIPDYLLPALYLYSASYCSINRFAGSAEIGQFKTKVDSGDPLDNPYQALSDFLLRRFEIEMGRFQQRQRGSY